MTFLHPTLWGDAGGFLMLAFLTGVLALMVEIGFNFPRDTYRGEGG